MSSTSATLIGPFTQLLTMDGLPLKGPVHDQQLHVIQDAAIAIEKGIIIAIGPYSELCGQFMHESIIEEPCVVMPGLIDSHTHICFAGSRAFDYAQRINGKTYQEIAKNGGGILDTVAKTRTATKEELVSLTLQRCQRLSRLGITTCEVKSGYGLNLNDEIKILKAIATVDKIQPISLISTCLAAHTRPPEYTNNAEYLDFLITELLPIVKAEGLCNRIDIFVDETAFSVEEARTYLTRAQQLDFTICLHADQFQRGGSLLAAELHALSADHLEASTSADFKMLADADVTAIALPGASLGLGVPLPRVRQMLDNGLTVAIASDWNPGSAPMGNLLAEAAILGAAEKLSLAETLSGITSRAAKALGLNDRGRLAVGLRGDLAVFPCMDYREILYHQGSLVPLMVYIEGRRYL